MRISDGTETLEKEEKNRTSSAKTGIAVRCLLFFAVLLIAFRGLYGIFGYRGQGGGGGLRNFYAAKRGSIDLMVFGSSHSHCTFDNSRLWKDTGIASYTLTAGAQSFDNTWYYVREALKTQHPQLVMVETFNVALPAYDEAQGRYVTELGNFYRTDLDLKWSADYAEVIRSQKQAYGLDDEFAGALLFKLPILHTRYESLGEDNFRNRYWFRKGYLGSDECAPQPPPEPTDERSVPQGIGPEALVKIMDLCGEKGVNLLLYCAPCAEGGGHNMAVQNYVADLCAERNVPYLNFNTFYGETGIDFATDFRDSGHLNNNGSAKLMTWLERWLTEHYTFPDHRGDPAYAEWDLDARYLEDRADFLRLARAGDINEYLEILAGSADRYVTVITLDGDYNAQGEDAYAPSLAAWGISRQAYLEGGCFVLENGALSYASGAGEGSYVSRCGRRPVTAERRPDEDGACTDRVRVGTTDCTTDTNGANILVYDAVLDVIVDAAYIDVYESLLPQRGIDVDEISG